MKIKNSGPAVVAILASLAAGGFAPPDNSKEMAAREATAKAALAAEMKLARAEGLITSLADMKAWVPPVPESQNAAPFYRRLSIENTADTSKVIHRQLDVGDPAAVKLAEEVLSKRAADLKLIDEAVKRPKLWFDRDYSLGPAVLKPELARIKDSVKLLLIRGAVARRQGRTQEAIADQKKALVISDHLAQEKGLIDLLVGLACRSLVRDQLIRWSIDFPSEPSWRNELKRLGESWPIYSHREAMRPYLFEALVCLELCSTKSGRIKIGLKDDPETAFQTGLTRALRAPSEGRLQVVQAFRSAWKKVKSGKLIERDSLQDEESLFWQGMIVEPYAARLYEGLSDGAPFFDSRSAETASMGGKVLTEAAWRMVSEPRVEPSRVLAGMKSPADGLPLRLTQDNDGLLIKLVDDPESDDWPKLLIRNLRAPKPPTELSGPR